MVWNGHTHKLTDVAVFVFTCQYLFEPLMSDMHDQVRLLSSFSPRHRYYNRVSWPMLSGRQVRWLCRRSNSVLRRKLSMSRAPTKVQASLDKSAASAPYSASGSRLNTTASTSKPIVVRSSRSACVVGLNKRMRPTATSYLLAMHWRASPTVIGALRGFAPWTNRCL